MNLSLSTCMTLQSILLALCFLSIGCSISPNKLSKQPFVSLHNQTKSNVDYKIRISNKWSNATTLQSHKEAVLLSYSGDITKSVPAEIEHLIIYLPSCQLHMNRRLIETYMVPPANRQKGWELTINTELLSIVRCK